MRGFRPARVVALATVMLGVLAAPSFALEGPPAQVGQWGPVLNWGVQGKHMVLLHTGKVLVWSKGDQAARVEPGDRPVPAHAGAVRRHALRRPGHARRRPRPGGRRPEQRHAHRHQRHVDLRPADPDVVARRRHGQGPLVPDAHHDGRRPRARRLGRRRHGRARRPGRDLRPGDRHLVADHAQDDRASTRSCTSCPTAGCTRRGRRRDVVLRRQDRQVVGRPDRAVRQLGLQRVRCDVRARQDPARRRRRPRHGPHAGHRHERRLACLAGDEPDGLPAAAHEHADPARRLGHGGRRHAPSPTTPRRPSSRARSGARPRRGGRRSRQWRSRGCTTRPR